MISSAKRNASKSPDERTSKRPAPSSPEEGELDDTAPPPPHSSLPAKPKTKVAFPFKTKVTTTTAAVEMQAEVRVIYERPPDLEVRPSASSRLGDHWEPDHRHYSHRRGDHPWDHNSRSWHPRSRSQSRSPNTRVNHRLPARSSRSPEASSRHYREGYGDADNGRRRRRLSPTRYRDRWENDRDRPYRGYPSMDSYRPQSPTEGGRERGRRPRSPDGGYYQRRGSIDGRRPPSPTTSLRSHDTYRPLSPYRPRSPTTPPPSLPLKPGTPPPPPSNALAPPPSDPLPPPPRVTDNKLPQEHATVSISLPSKPVEASKTACTLPQPTARQDGLPPKAVAPPPVPRPAPRKKGPMAQLMPEEEEKERYGRVFLGCGKQSDYNMTTKLGEGTFGEVHKAVQIKTGAVVALKRIMMHNEKEGMPVTALREIKILKALRHPCIVSLLDMFVVRSNGKDPLSVYMVFPYMDHDLAGLLENERVKLSPSQIKLYMKQLLEGTDFMHRNNILHRDMKAANLLISNDGRLHIADFGLARAFDKTGTRERKYTNCVVTRWYRPPELLMGARDYGGEVDMWGIGCVLGEMFFRKPILAGASDLDQLQKIFQLCGTPNQHTWPNFDKLPDLDGFRTLPQFTKKLRIHFHSLGEETLDLLDKLLQCNPRERITAGDALDHEYFWSEPLPADPKTLPTYEASHEYDKRSRRPMPMEHVPPVQHRPPPPAMSHFGREAPNFRNGPPPSHFPPHGRPPRGGRGRPPPPSQLPLNPSLPPKPTWR